MQVHNTLGRAAEEFRPARPGRVGIYVCGPTVQAAPHVGHGRSAVAFDVMRRYLEWVGFEVLYVSNITDVDDKIIARAAARGVAPEQVASEATEQFLRAHRLLGVRPPDVQPRATDHIPEMIELIEELVAAGHAYPAGGDVYFAVRSFPGYGKLSGHNIDDLVAGARVEPGEHKRDSLDFALWKAAKPGEPSWDAPWGAGRPGWHIECSAMAKRYLGHGFDIHGGGRDLVFPHHENEIAQSEALAGSPFARYWLHNGFVNLGGEKMSKSTGLVTDLLELLDAHQPAAVRLFYLRKRYREPLEFTSEALDDAAGSLERLRAFRRRVDGAGPAEPDPAAMAAFRSAMDDDFNTAEALAALFETVREGNRLLDSGADAAPHVAAYDAIVGVLGLSEAPPDLADRAPALARLAGDLGLDTDASPPDLVDALLAYRQEARARRDWAGADAVRDRLAELGIVVEDGADGVRWHRR